MQENRYLPVQNLRRTKINHFGICFILFFRHKDILNWPGLDPLSGGISSALVFKPGAAFYACQVIEKDRIFKEDHREAGAGPYVETTVTGSLGGNNVNHITATAAMMGEQFGLLIQSRNGEQRLIGRRDAGAKFIWDFTEGNGGNSRKRDVKWVYESEFPVPVYAGGSVVIDNTIIPVGGATPPPGGASSFSALNAFIVGSPGAPMNPGDTVLTNPALLNKNVIVFADGMPIPQPPVPVPSKRTITKVFNQNTITFHGGVMPDEIIQIFTY
jgi:hypothetical protein